MTVTQILDAVKELAVQAEADTIASSLLTLAILQTEALTTWFRARTRYTEMRLRADPSAAIHELIEGEPIHEGDAILALEELEIAAKILELLSSVENIFLGVVAARKSVRQTGNEEFKRRFKEALNDW